MMMPIPYAHCKSPQVRLWKNDAELLRSRRRRGRFVVDLCGVQRRARIVLCRRESSGADAPLLETCSTCLQATELMARWSKDRDEAEIAADTLDFHPCQTVPSS